MSDGRALARAYLEQQQLLGTDAVVLPPAPGVAASPAAAAQPAASAPSLPQPDSETPGSRPGLENPALGGGARLTPGVSPGIAKAVPSTGSVLDLPPPGLSYDPPGGDLFASDPIQQATTLASIATLVAACTKCRLCQSRTHTVPGEGPGDAKLVVVGEGPGRTEDATGRPFVGQAGDLLTKILAAIDLPREQVYICNVVKCRPPENRVPLYDEIGSCVPYLFRQLDLIRPRVILAMGNTAAQTVLNTKQSLGALRNKVHRLRGVPVIVTYHPAALLRNPNWKKPTWDDVRIAHRLLDG